jgi:hypothetical protein
MALENMAAASSSGASGVRDVRVPAETVQLLDVPRMRDGVCFPS